MGDLVITRKHSLCKSREQSVSELPTCMGEQYQKEFKRSEMK
jgi:hypothetical protein